MAVDGVPVRTDAEKRPAARRRMGVAARTLRIIVVGYLGVLLVLMFLENRLIYYPTAASQFWEGPPNESWQDLWLKVKANRKVHAWWCPREKDEGVLLYCHGNGGNLSHRGRLIVSLQQALGVSVLIFDYPGYGKSEGSPSEAGCYAAGEAAYSWLKEKYAGDKIFLYGNSLGGGVATQLAVNRPHRALILAKTFTSLPDIGQRHYPWLPVHWVMRNRFDNLKRIKECRQPVFISHGVQDRLVPFEHGQALFAAANEPKYLHRVEGGDHNTPIDAQFFRALKSFLIEAESRASAPLAHAQPITGSVQR